MGDLRKKRHKKGLEEPQILEDQAEAKARVLPQFFKHGLHFGKQFLPEGVLCFHFLNEGGKSGDR